jgi:trigger factor
LNEAHPDREEETIVVKSKNVETLPNSAVKVTVSVEKESIQKEYDELLAEYCRTVRLDGFRRGKVPPNVVLRKFGDVLVAQTTEKVIRKSLEEVLEGMEQKPIGVSVPEVDSEASLELGKDYTYTLTYDTYPTVELPQYKGLEYKELQVEIQDEDLQRELAALQDQNSIVTDKKDATVLNGDIVNIDYVQLDEQDQEITANKREGFVFETGSGYNLYKIDNELVGMKGGEERLIEKEYPADYEFKELAGQKVRLKVKLNGVKEKQLPEINDELAQDISDKYQTLEDLRQDIQKRLSEYAARKIREHSISQLLDKIADGAKVELPKSMVETELEERFRLFVSRLGGDEQPVLQELEKEGKSKEALLEEWRPAAERKLRLQLAVGQMVKQENIELAEEEIDSRVQAEAEAQNLSLEEAKQAMLKNNYLEYLKFDLKNEKLYDLLLQGGVKQKGKKVKFLDLVRGNY